MMYRPSAAAATARRFINTAVTAGTNALSFAHDAMMGALIKAGIYEQAMRENRRIDRSRRRDGHSARNAAAFPLHAQRIAELAHAAGRAIRLDEPATLWVPSLIDLFVWHATNEGHDYWEAIALRDGYTDGKWA